MSFALRSALAAALLALAACGGAASTADEGADDLQADARLNVRGRLAPQSFLHDAVSDLQPQASFTFTAAAGDVVAPDVWPAPSDPQSALRPVLTLLGPSHNGKRPLLATGKPRGGDDRHMAIDGFRVARSGTYLVSVAQAAKGSGGAFTLRFWTSASHAPRPEDAQLSLAVQPSDGMTALLARHAGASAPSWTDAELDRAVSLVQADSDALTAFSDAEQLAFTLAAASAEGKATAAQASAANAAAASVVGTAAEFASLGAEEQAFALYWLGDLTRAAFDVREVTGGSSAALRAVSAQIGALVRSWSGAHETTDARHVRALSMNGSIYGYVADWSCTVDDTDGTPVFAWYSTDYFDHAGRWLGEQSAGASEPEDD